jgi:hypothetical protein
MTLKSLDFFTDLGRSLCILRHARIYLEDLHVFLFCLPVYDDMRAGFSALRALDDDT